MVGMEKEIYEPKSAEFYLQGSAIEVAEHLDAVGHRALKSLAILPQHISVMVGALSHKHSLVRTRAAVTFGKIGRREALRPLQAALRAETDGLAQMAMQTAIRNIENPLKT